MTLLELQTEMARETNNDATTLNATTKARFLAAINRHYRRIASFAGLQHLRNTTTTFPTVANQAEYQIGSVAKIERIWIASERRLLEPMSLAEYRMLSPQAITDTTGTPTHWVWESYSGSSTSKFDLYLYPTPDSVLTMTADIVSVLTPLAIDADVPILPHDFHDLLFLGALVDEYRHLDDTRAMLVQQQLAEREKQFKYWMHETASGAMTGMAQPSQLGSQFPANT